MSINLVKYRDWVFEADVSQTAAVYKHVTLSGTESCDCGNCRYFNNVSDQIYPGDVKLLFKQLGIDSHKNYEVCDMGDEQTGHIYNGWFHFIGKMIDGNDCKVPLHDGGYTFDLLAISDSFSIGFSNIISPTFFKE